MKIYRAGSDANKRTNLTEVSKLMVTDLEVKQNEMVLFTLLLFLCTFFALNIYILERERKRETERHGQTDRQTFLGRMEPSLDSIRSFYE